MATGGHRRRAVVAIGFRWRVANQREADAVMQHPGAGHYVGDLGQVGLRLLLLVGVAYLAGRLAFPELWPWF
jgi:hypothetical protein